MDKKRGLLNITTSVGVRVVLMIAALYVRRLLIMYVGNEANGLNSLYASVIGLLGVAELGVGSAIVFSMYHPIVDGDDKKVAALYGLYKKLYRIIGAVIFAGGLIVMPFLPRMISDYDQLDINVNITFILTLISVVISYLYGAKTSLIEAHKDNYITTLIGGASRLLRYCLQVAALLIWKSFTIFLVCQIIETIVIGFGTEAVVRRMYPEIIRAHEKLDDNSARELSRNIRAMFMHKLGVVLVGAVDNMVISAFVGIVMLGKYSNYIAIVTAMSSIISLLFSPLTSVIGHLCASSDTEDIKRYFNHLYSLNYIVGVIFFLGYFAVIDDVIALVFGPGLEMARTVAFAVAASQFISYLRYAQLLFRDATGTFYYDRWKPFAEGVSNLILSVMLVKVLPEEYSVIGVIVATIITSLVICDIVEPHILFKYVFGESAKRFCIRNYGGITVFGLSMILMEAIRLETENRIAGIAANGFMSIALSVIVLGFLSIADPKFRRECAVILSQGRTRLGNKEKGRDGKDGRDKDGR